MKKYFLTLILGILVFPINALGENDNNYKIFFSEVRTSDTCADYLETKYYIYDIKNKSRQEIINRSLANVCYDTPKILLGFNYIYFFTKEKNKQYACLLNIQNNTKEVFYEVPLKSSGLIASNNLKYMAFYRYINEDDWKSQKIFLSDLISKQILQITNNNVPDYDPIFSKDGESLFFLEKTLSEKNAMKTILKCYQIDKKQTTDLKVFSDSGYRLFQCLNNGEVLMARKDKGGIPFRLNLQTGKMTDLNIDRISDISISPDEKKMVYLQYMGYEDPAWDVFISDIDGKNVQKIPNARNIDIMAPQWVI